MVNYLSIDFESWTYPELSEFKKLESKERKRLDGGYVKESAEKILTLLAKHKTQLTFFVLGQLYDWYPEVIEKIAQDGHEIAYHTYTHDILNSKMTLVKSLNQSKKFLNKFKPRGFRAPNIVFKREYLPILKEYGFKYDSSVYSPYSEKRSIDGLTEIPISTLFRLPVGSGYFVALLGGKISWFYRQINRNGNPIVAFVHNWQIIKPKKATFPNINYLSRHPYYLPYTFEICNTFEYLLKNFSFAPMVNLIRGNGRL